MLLPLATLMFLFLFASSVIRLNMPPVTEDRRKELAKEAKGLGEEGKVGSLIIHDNTILRSKANW